MIRGSIPIWRTLSRRAKWLIFAAFVLFLLVPATYYAVRYASARARLDAAIAEARAKGEPVWFSDLDPGPERNPSEDAKELLALCRQLVMTKEDAKIVFNAESIVRNGNDDGRLQVTEEEYERIDEIATLNENILNQIFEIAQRGDCWFKYDFTDPSPWHGQTGYSDDLNRVEDALNAQMASCIRSKNERLALATVLGFFELGETFGNRFGGILDACHYQATAEFFRGNLMITNWSKKAPWGEASAKILENRLKDLEENFRWSSLVLHTRANAMTSMQNLEDEDNQELFSVFLDIPDVSPAWLEEVIPGDAIPRKLNYFSSLPYRPSLLEQQALVLHLSSQQAMWIDDVGTHASEEMKRIQKEIESIGSSRPLCEALAFDFAAERNMAKSLRQSFVNGAFLLQLGRTLQRESLTPETLAAEIATALESAPIGYISGETVQYELENSTVTLFDVSPKSKKQFGHFSLRLWDSSATADSEAVVETDAD